MSSYLTAEEFSALMTEEVDPQPRATTKPRLVTLSQAEPPAPLPTTPLRPIPVTEVASRPTAQVAVPTGDCNAGPTHDPMAKPSTGLNLRLNEYQIELIRQLAAKQERSMQQVIRRTLIPAVEKALSCAD